MNPLHKKRNDAQFNIKSFVARWQFLWLKNPGSTPGSGEFIYIYIYIYFSILWLWVAQLGKKFYVAKINKLLIKSERCYVYNIFIINHKWLVVIGSNLKLTLRLLFCLNNSNSNNLPLRICCKNIVDISFLIKSTYFILIFLILSVAQLGKTNFCCKNK